MKIFILLVILFYDIHAFAQPGLDEFGRNELKYWKLRGRLTGDENNKDVYNGFMTVGDGNGKSIPAAQRNPTYKRNSDYFNPISGGCKLQEINGVQVYTYYNNGQANGTPIIDVRDGFDVNGILSFSDNSIIQIGNYLGILATEWALLHRDGKSTANTEKELYYALLALDRLDNNGENLYGISQVKNGFLMRTDVDEMFQLNTSGKNIDLVIAPIACQNDEATCDAGANTVVKTSNAMSQDEVIGLLLGVALIKKMMPYYASYNGVGLRQWSREIAQRIVYYVRSGGTTNYWTIVDPDQKKRVCRGSFAIWNSYPMAATMQYISNNITQNGWSMNLGKFLWKLRKDLYAQNNNNVVLGIGVPSGLQTELGLNAYEYIFVPGNNNWSHDGAFNVGMFLKLLSTSFTAPRPYLPFLDMTGKYLINTVSQTYKKDLYELLGSVIYGYSPVQTESYWRGQFNSLNCGCNCIQGTDANGYKNCDYYYSLVPPNIPLEPNDPPGEWSVEDRWAYNRQYGGSYPANGDDPGTLNEYNGLDYMLAHNLYRWKYFDDGYDDRVRLKWTKDFPYLSNQNQYDNNNQYQIGSTQYPYKVKSVFSIEASNTIGTTTNIEYLAGSDIKLLPGFKAKLGSVFKARIKDMDCEPNIIQVPNAQNVAWKNGSYNDGFDSLVNIQLDGDSANYYDEGPPVDTNAFTLIYTNNIDTFVYDLSPDYMYTDSGEIVYAPANNKAALDEVTINNITLFPNPTSTSANLAYMLYYDSEVKIIVTNELGQEMRNVVEQEVYTQKKGKQNITLNTANLSAGVYFCMVELNGRRQVLKFSVLR